MFEQSHRIGGRLLSVEPPGIPGVFCELGGMRYMSSQALVRSLIENKLKLETRPFVVQMPENLNYVRGQRFRNSDLANHVNVPFELSWSERGVTVDTVLASVLNQIIPGVTKMQASDLREFLAEYGLERRPVRRGRELLERPRPQPGRDPAHDAARSAAAGVRLR